MATKGSRRYTPADKEAALALAVKVGPGAAAKQLGIPDGTITGWRAKVAQASEAPKAADQSKATEQPAEASPTPADRSRSAVAKRYTPLQKAEILEYASAHSVTEAAAVRYQRFLPVQKTEIPAAAPVSQRMHRA